MLRDSQLPANTNQAVAFIRPKEKRTSRFLYYWLSGHCIQERVRFRAVQAAQPNLSLGNIGEFVVPVLPATEQETVTAYLDRETARIDALTGKVREAIERLREYRTALISAAVTGKIDVREEAGEPMQRTTAQHASCT